MQPAVTPDLGETLRELFARHRLSPSQRRVARYLLDAPEQAAFATSSEVAERVGVSQPSVTRLATALGLSGYAQLRERVRAEVLPRRTDGPDGAAPDSENAARTLVSAEIDALRTLQDSLADTAALRRVARGLAASRPLPVVGLRVSAPLAHLVGYLAARAHPDVRILDAPGSVLADALTAARDAGATWVLGIGLPRHPRELADGLRHARELGLSVALLTDSPLGPLADLADELLVAPVTSYAAFDAHAAPTVLCTALLHALVEELGPEGQARLEALDAAATARDVFLPS
jgi:DNA-binding MurR/RpiR family transcriptional regulator